MDPPRRGVAAPARVTTRLASVSDSTATPADYLATARKRGGRRGPSRRAPSRAAAAGKPYGAPTKNRYAVLSAPPVAQAAPAKEPTPETERVAPNRRGARAGRRAPEAAAAPAAPLAVSLDREFARVRQGQEAEKQTRRLPIAIRRPARPVRTAILSIVAVTIIVVAAVVGPVLYRGTRAYQEIFQDPVPHAENPFVAQVNPEGTSVIVTATATAGVAIPEWDGKDRVTILLLGVDTREDEASRSDTMILVNIDPATKAASMLSIPRDMKVIVPGYGVHKINSAYAFGDADKVPGGGPGLVIRTIEANFGIPVNYYAQVDFKGFTKIIDTIGGLTIDVPYPIKDDEYPGPGNQYMRIFFQTGWQHMDGTQVLQYARTRHDDGDGRRSARQQQVLLALRDQAISKNLLSKAPQLLADLGDAVRTDLQPNQALQLARLGSEIDPAAIVQYSLDDALTEEAIEGQPYFLVADWSAVGQILTQFTGTQVTPPMSALASANLNAEIRIEDGTFNPGLGDRVKEVLVANGFTNVTVTDKPDLGNYPTSSITTDSNSLTTAYFAANLLGLDLSAINASDAIALTPTPNPSAATATPTPTSSSASAAASPAVDTVPFFPTPTGQAGTAAAADSSTVVVIVLGDDAPDPAYFTTDPYTDDTVVTGDGGDAPVDQSTDQPVDQTVDESVDTGYEESGDVSVGDETVDGTVADDGSGDVPVDDGSGDVPIDDSGG